MNKLVIPPSPNWYASNVFACTLDNTVVYGSRNEIVVIHPTPPEQAAEITVLVGLHSARVSSVAVNENWGNPNKWAVSAADDNVIQLIDIATCRPKISHVAHKTRPSDKVVGAVFGGEDKVISISTQGFMVVWKISTNGLTPVNSVIGSNNKVTTISSCPHAPWLIGLGLKNGKIIILDLKKNGQILYKFKGHDGDVVSLSWCPTPYNVFPRKIPQISQIVNESSKNTNIESDLNTQKEIGNLPSSEVPLHESQVVVINKNATLQVADESANCNEAGELENKSNISKEVVNNQAINNENDDTLINNLHGADYDESNVKGLDENAKDSYSYLTNDQLEKHDAELETPEELENYSSGRFKPLCECIEQQSSSDPFLCLEKTEDSSSSTIQSERLLSCESFDTKKESDFYAESDQLQNHPRSCLTSETSNQFVSCVTENKKVVDENVKQKMAIKLLRDGEFRITLLSVINQNKSHLDMMRNVTEEDFSKETNESASTTVNSEESLQNPVTVVENEVCISKTTEIANSESEEIPHTNDKFDADAKSGEATEQGQDDDDSNVKKTESEKEYLLASSARGSRCIKIWRAGTDGMLQTELILPKTSVKHSYKYFDKSWISLCWVTPNDLLSSSGKGQLLHWRLNSHGVEFEKKQYRVIHADHSKYIFSIAAPIRKYESIDDEDWRDKNLLNAWTFGIDRFILNTSLNIDHKNLASHPTIGGPVACLVPSPIDPTRIACGLGDGNSRFLDLSLPHLQRFTMAQLNSCSLKVNCLAWHPKKEACLAYGTNDGHVGILDANNVSKKPSEMIHASHGAVYHLQWAPIDGDAKNLGLYTISAGKLYVHDTKNSLHGPRHIEFSTDVQLAAFAWKPDYSQLAVATKSCELLLYDNEMTLTNTFLLQNKTVRCLAWHPPGTDEKNWLALCSNQVIVYDCSLNLSSDDPNKYEKCAVAVFTQHRGVVYNLSWSPHHSEVLASVGEDGKALVWNVKTKTLLHACMSKFDVLYAVLWSPFDPDYLITGGRGCIIRIWKLSENPPVLEISNGLENVQQHSLTLATEKDDINEPVTKSEPKQKRPPKCFLNGIAEIHNAKSDGEIFEDCVQLFRLLNPNGNGDCDAHHKINVNTQSTSTFNIFQLFGDENGIEELLIRERENHKNKATPFSLENISLLNGDIGDTIRNAIKCQTLNHCLVMIAPTVSYKLWQEACEAYAKQLVTLGEGRTVEAAYCYLGLHKVEEAIDALCTGTYFREALIVAKTRLCPTDPLINDVILKWAAYATSVGKFEIAAQCYIVLNKLDDAAKVLFRRSDVPTLEFCVTLAEKTGNTPLLDAILFRLNVFKSNSDNKSENSLLPLTTRLELEIKNVSENGTHASGSINDDQNVLEVSKLAM